jgi:hypothetical protein
MPGWKLTNLYGPAPMGARRNPSSPTFSMYFLGTTHPAPEEGHEIGPRLGQNEAHAAGIDHLRLADTRLEQRRRRATITLE